MAILRPSGGDDYVALQAAIDKGGTVEIPDPAAVFKCSRPLLYGSNTNLRIAAKILFDSPGVDWPNTYLMGPRANAGNGLRHANVTIDMSMGGQLIGLSDKTPTTLGGQHGLMLGFTDGFRIIEPTIIGDGNRNLFAINIRRSNNGVVTGGYVSHRTKWQGADGFHVIGNSRDILIEGLATASGDDSSSQTLENSLNESNSVIERITYRNCLLRNFDHSSVKLLILPEVGDAAVIRDIRYENCDMVTVPSFFGAGTPVWCVKNNPAQLVERVSIKGGRLRVSLPNPRQYVGGPLITLAGIKDFSLVDTDIEFFARQLVTATDCPGLIFRPKSVQVYPGREVPPPSNATALVRLQRCAGAVIDTSKLAPVYPGQTIVSAT